MQRTTLRVFLRRFVLVSALPLCGCPAGRNGTGDCGEPKQTRTIVYDGGVPWSSDLGSEKPTCNELCDPVAKAASAALMVKTCELMTLPNGNDQLTCVLDDNCVFGRRPIGLAVAAPRGEDAVGAFWARMAHLEAASIEAFLRLADELVRHGAPASLIAQARRAASDEVRHARIATALAAQRGVAVPPVEISAAQPMSLSELAIDNSMQGQIGETYGAIVATWQAQAAPRGVARLLGQIARDETRHSELATSLGAWLSDRLTVEERERVALARLVAMRSLATAIDVDVLPELVAEVGVPTRTQARQLFAAAVEQLWS